MSKGRLTKSVLAAAVIPFAWLAIGGPAQAAYDNVPTPTVTGPLPVTKTDYPFLATDIDLKKYGYVEEEYFVEGLAYRYDTTTGGIEQNGSPIVTGGPNSDGTYPFKTRIVVRRPSNPAKANGTLVAEWNNVTSTQDVEFNWFGDPFFLLENGYTMVAITAQQAGSEALRLFNPSRYGSLNVNGGGLVGSDGLSFGIFSSVVKALRGIVGPGSSEPLGGVNVRRVIASGQSQSCARLATHHNKIEPLHGVIDGFLLTVCGAELRTDRPNEKVVRVLSELESQVRRSPEQFPDTSSIRHWEVAAASHLPRMTWDNLAPTFNRDFRPGGSPLTVSCEKSLPLSLVEFPFTVNRAVKGLSDWIDGGDAPPIASRSEYVDNPDFDPSKPTSATNRAEILDRDRFGLAKGGIRYPTVTVPTATNDGINAPAQGASAFSLFCGLLGSSKPLPPGTLSRLYRDHADYVRKYSRAADKFRKTGFILAEDVRRLKTIARQYPRLRPSKPTAKGKGKASRLTWVGTEAPKTKFTVQRKKAKGKANWVRAKVKVTGNRAILRREPKGVWRYRVRSSTVIPENNILPPERITTAYSQASKPVRIR